MTTELYWLILTLVLTGLLWVPYILQLIVQQGVVTAIWDPTGAHPHEADWAIRAKRAHTNAVENIAVFAPLVILVEMQGLNGGITETAAIVFFFARFAHFFIYMAALPVIRTIVFVIGFGCQMVMAGRLLGMV